MSQSEESSEIGAAPSFDAESDEYYVRLEEDMRKVAIVHNGQVGESAWEAFERIEELIKPMVTLKYGLQYTGNALVKAIAYINDGKVEMPARTILYNLAKRRAPTLDDAQLEALVLLEAQYPHMVGRLYKEPVTLKMVDRFAKDLYKIARKKPKEERPPLRAAARQLERVRREHVPLCERVKKRKRE